MPYNGNGTFNLEYNWPNDAQAGIDISSSRMQAQEQDMAGGLSNCMTRDGQSPPSANIPMGTNIFTNLGQGSNPTDSVNLTQVQALIAAAVALAFPIGMIASWDASAHAIPANFQLCDGTNGTPDMRNKFQLGGVPVQVLSSLTNAALVATATTAAAHSLKTGDSVTIAGCTPTAYNGTYAITVTSATTFTYTLATNPGGVATVVGTYSPTYGDGVSGGSPTATLAVTNMPAHNHAVTDPGHNHAHSDPGHNHGITDPGHAHSFSISTNGVFGVQARAVAGDGSIGATANTNAAATGISLAASATGVTNVAAATGVTTQNNGSGTPFPIIPPYYSLCYVQRMS